MALGCREILLSILCIHISLLRHTSAQQAVKYFCSNGIGNYTTNTTFQANLNNILSSIPSNINTSGFYYSSSGRDVDKVNALALCRGDLDIDTCRSCVNNSIYNLTRVCPNQKEAIGWYDGCMLRYSNTSILGIMSLQPGYALENVIDASNPNRFSQELSLMADKLLRQAYNGSLRKFAAVKSSNPDVQTIYAYMQCTPDITNGDCNFCLNLTAKVLSECCYRKIGARYQNPSCSFQYEISPFVNVSSKAK